MSGFSDVPGAEGHRRRLTVLRARSTAHLAELVARGGEGEADAWRLAAADVVLERQIARAAEWTLGAAERPAA